MYVPRKVAGFACCRPRSVTVAPPEASRLRRFGAVLRDVGRRPRRPAHAISLTPRVIDGIRRCSIRGVNRGRCWDSGGLSTSACRGLRAARDDQRRIMIRDAERPSRSSSRRDEWHLPRSGAASRLLAMSLGSWRGCARRAEHLMWRHHGIAYCARLRQQLRSEKQSQSSNISSVLITNGRRFARFWSIQ